MKKEAIIDIIEHDLNEIKTLLETFKDADKIPSAFLELLSSKHAALGKEIMLLGFWKEQTNATSQIDTPIEIQQPKVAKTPQVNVTEEGFNTDLDFCNEDNNCFDTKEEPTIAVTPDVESSKPTIESTSVAPQATTAEQPKQVVQSPKKAESQPRKSSPSVSDITNFGLPVDDIRKAISIADRFLYQRELFGNNNETMNSTLEAINSLTSYEEAYSFLKSSFNWDETDTTVENFLKTIHRRFL